MKLSTLLVTMIIILVTHKIYGQDACFTGTNIQNRELETVIIDYSNDEVIYQNQTFQIIKKPATYKCFKSQKTADIECTDEYLNKIIFRYFENLLTGKKKLYIMIEGKPMRIIELKQKAEL